MTPEQLIRSLSPRYGLDATAVLAVAMGEGGLVNREDDRGDGGRSFGPFQLYEKGALPQHLVGRGDEADTWSWSPAGIEYALGRMKAAGASGLTGADAVDTIVRKFERPADPDTSVRNAVGRLGGIGTQRPAQAQAQPGVHPGRGTTVATTAAPQVSDPRSRLASMLLGRSMQRRGRPMSPALSGLLDRRMQATGSDDGPDAPQPVAPSRAPVPPVTAGGGSYPYNPLRAAYKPLGAPGQGTHSPGEGPDNWQSDNAWDYGANPGTPVYATDAGVVDPNRYGPQASSGRFGGYRLTIDGDESDQFYGHLADNLAVKPGQRVSAGDLLGYIGSIPGLASHLHYGRTGR